MPNPSVFPILTKSIGVKPKMAKKTLQKASFLFTIFPILLKR